MWIAFAHDHFHVARKRYSWGFFTKFYQIFPDPTHVIGQFCACDKVCDV